MNVKKKDFIWNIVGVTSNSIISLFLLIIVNRINGTFDAGIFSYTFSLACLFYIIAIYYNRTYQVSDIKNKYSNNEYITTRILTSIIALMATLLFCLINKFSLFKSIIFFSLMIFKIAEALSDCFYAFIQKKNQLYYVSKSLFNKFLFGLILFLIIDILTKNLIYAISGIVIVNIIGLIIDIKKYFSLYNEKFILTFINVKKLLKKTFPIFLFLFLNIFLCNCQKYVLEYFMTEQYQMIFGIIVMPATMLGLCGQYLLNPYLFEFSKLFNHHDYNTLNSKVKKINFVFILLGIVILLMAFLLGIPVLNIVYSINLNNYKMAFMIIIIGAIFYGLSSIISTLLTIIDKNKEQLHVYVISSCMALIISIILIKKFELIGASYAYLMVMIVHFILNYYLLNKYLYYNKNEGKK